MDRKTVAYMKSRVEKAEVIIKKIDHLTQIANGLFEFPENTESDIRIRNARLNTTPTNSHRRLHKSIMDSMSQLIADEIALLEQELAEI